MDSENKLGGNFTIDDAFESDEEDPIRVYGSRATTERSALTEKRRPEDVKVEVDEHHEQVSRNIFFDSSRILICFDKKIVRHEMGSSSEEVGARF